MGLHFALEAGQGYSSTDCLLLPPAPVSPLSSATINLSVQPMVPALLAAAPGSSCPASSEAARMQLGPVLWALPRFRTGGRAGSEEALGAAHCVPPYPTLCSTSASHGLCPVTGEVRVCSLAQLLA